MHKAGDKFIIEIGGEYPENPFEDGENGKAPTILYKIKGFNSLVFDKNGLEKLEKYDENAGYEKGLSDAWEVAKKIWLNVADGGIDCVTIRKVFGVTADEVMTRNTPQEAVAKIKEWEEKHEIKVGDVVIVDDLAGDFVVTRYKEKTAHCMSLSTGAFCVRDCEKIAKTGKHIDLTEIFKGLEGEDV